MEPMLFDESASFVTKTFFIRYAEEVVTLRDIVKFRTEVDCGKLHHSSKYGQHQDRAEQFMGTEFFLKVELFFAPPPAHNFHRSVQSADVMKNEL